ncbi:MAG: bifunctional adenosylcobinamide kinase/adenosylcobinamide-phosphate guanylyltransferase [Planctomycetota bacterium]
MSVTLITGGARSGKSTHAMMLAATWRHRCFIATAEATDDEMRERIALHQAQRGESWPTIEEPLDLAEALARIPAATEVVLIDCLSVWIGNLLHHRGHTDEHYPETWRFLDALRHPPCNLIVVTNEVGMGIVPEHALARRYRDIAGTLNQRVAAIADRVELCVCGLPVTIKSVHHDGT